MYNTSCFILDLSTFPNFVILLFLSTFSSLFLNFFDGFTNMGFSILSRAN
jgi:hypothetical protein